MRSLQKVETADFIQLGSTNLCEVKLQGIVCGERHVQPAVEVLRQRVAVVVQEQGVVAEGGHGNADLGQVEQVLEHGYLGRER